MSQAPSKPLVPLHRTQRVIPADLRGAEFRGLDLSSFALPAADLRGAHFINCRFSPSQPEDVGANFIDADLRGVRFTDEQMGRATAPTIPVGAVVVSLDRATELHRQVENAPIAGVAIATRNDLLWLAQQALLPSRLDLRHAEVFESDLAEWNLEHSAATFIDAERAQRLDMSAVSNVARGRPPFEKARLETPQDIWWIKYQSGRTTIPDAGAPLVDVRFADLSAGVFIGVDFSHADLRHTSLVGASCSYGLFQRANCEEADFADAKLMDADFRGAIARSARFGGCVATNADFLGATLVKADLDGADMQAANLSTADLRGADCRRARFQCVDLRGSHVDASTSFIEVQVNDKTEFGDIAWHGVPILDIDWTTAPRIGDEAAFISTRGKPSTEGSAREKAYREVIRAYRQLWTILRSQGYEHASRTYRLREKALERLRLFERRKWVPLAQSLVAYLLTGYGEQPQNLPVVYGIVVLACAGIYFRFAQAVHYPMTIYQAIILSLSTFKGVYPSPFPSALRQPHVIGTEIALIGGAETIVGWLVVIGTTIIWERRLGGDVF